MINNNAKPKLSITLLSKPFSTEAVRAYRGVPKNQQRGVALLTILLLVVSITVVAGAMLASQKIAIRQSGLLFEQDQMMQDIKAGQALAVALIKADNEVNEYDSVQDAWAQPIEPYQLGVNTLTIEIRDEASRFNINNLYHDGAVDGAALEVFKRLLRQMGIEESVATAVLDWQDPDGTVYDDTASEAAIYQNNANRASAVIFNQPFLSIEQLSEVTGMNAENLAKLRPYVTAVPYYLPININTAKPEVLAALVDKATPEKMQSIVRAREGQPFDSIDDKDASGIWQVAPFNELEEDAQKAVMPLIAVESGAFMALITARDAQNTATAATNLTNKGQEQHIKQRFATVLISKVNLPQADRQGSGANAGTAGLTPTSNTTQNSPKNIQAFLPRLWAYPPSFN